MKKIGIIICHRYHTCAAGKCLRSLYNREGAFSIYKDEEIQLVGITTCGGCPGGNVEYAPAEMKRMVPKYYIWQLDLSSDIRHALTWMHFVALFPKNTIWRLLLAHIQFRQAILKLIQNSAHGILKAGKKDTRSYSR